MGWFGSSIPFVKFTGDCCDWCVERIRKLVRDVQSLNGTVSDLRHDVDANRVDINALKQTDSNLADSIQKEAEERRAADEALSKRIDDVSMGGDIDELRELIMQESEARQEADRALGEEINSVQDDVNSIKNSVQMAVDNADAAFKMADEILGTQVPRLESLIAAEAEARRQGDELNRTECITRCKAMSDRIDGIESTVSGFEGSINDLTKRVQNNESNISDLSKQVNKNTTDIASLTGRVADAEKSIESNTSRIEVLEKGGGGGGGGTAIKTYTYSTNAVITVDPNNNTVHYYTATINIPFAVARKDLINLSINARYIGTGRSTVSLINLYNASGHTVTDALASGDGAYIINIYPHKSVTAVVDIIRIADMDSYIESTIDNDNSITLNFGNGKNGTVPSCIRTIAGTSPVSMSFTVNITVYE